jgi:hypothetical protein
MTQYGSRQHDVKNRHNHTALRSIDDCIALYRTHFDQELRQKYAKELKFTPSTSVVDNEQHLLSLHYMITMLL